MVISWATNDENSHGFIIPLVSAYIIYTRRNETGGRGTVGNWPGLALSFLSLSLYLISSKAEMVTVQLASIVFFLWGIVLYLFGYNGFRAVAFPLLYLLFMIPVPAQIYSMATLPLQLFVTRISEIAGSLLQIPIYVEGNLIHLPGRTLKVVEACSGLRSMVSLLALSAVFGYFALRANWKRAILFFAGIPIAIIINVVRVLAIAIFLHFFHIDITSGPLHTGAGIAVFGVSVGLLIITAHLLSRWIPEA
jgi:exosortase